MPSRRGRPPSGWPAPSDPRGWVPAEPPRRRSRAAVVLPWLVVGVLAAVYGAQWLPTIAEGRLPWLSGLVPATARDHPRPGVEEAGSRLAPEVTVAAPGGTYAFPETRPGPDGEPAPVGWSPCRPVHVVVDPAGAPSDFATQVQGVLAEVSAATGLVLADDGTVTEAASADRDPFQPEVYGDRWAPVLVRFTDEATVPDLAGDVAGVAHTLMMADPVSAEAFIVSGSVYLDVTLLDRPGGYLPVLRHEVAHLVGLDHVDDPTQLMHPVTPVDTFQQGDLAGLAAVGRGPCAPGL
ncbi:peptidase M10A and M12B matrixin and adamalysin [Cellulomonas hominis]|uniref:peptidase M10A and M12B matrixin and adamalysin n=1 Tax=Cellulomonas hominis TaxID=156981 RepID=UPI00144466E8|nr:peptidase M10A and M12B matrixin and adamalysin [Cellulomonas hominis]NKY09356.1 peptidase M10A and M12B matrixin and adamalysin [Cellulomonas hominis]